MGAVIDSVAEDMTRAGVKITTSEGDEKVPDLLAAMSRLQIWQALNTNKKWGRLYGGSIGVLQISGQKLDTPLDPATVAKGQFKGIAIYDRWMLNPSIDRLIKEGPEMGLPEFYDIVNDPRSTLSSDPQSKTGQLRVHHSRCIREGGIQLPYFQAITENLWGESVLERLWDRLISFDNATMSTASLVDRANLRTVKVEGLRDVIAAGGPAYEGLLQFFEMMRKFQVNEGLTLLDKNDEFETDTYTFTGLPDILLQFGQQLSGAAEIPLMRLFGQPPAGSVGLGDTGDSVLRTYYDSINAKQESTMRNPVETILQVMWQSTFGTPSPKDLQFKFAPLWQMSDLDKSSVAKTLTDTVLAAFETGVIDRETTLKELRDSSVHTGVFANITDESIADAEGEDPPPPPGSEPEAAPGEEKPKPFEKAKDGFFRRLFR